MSEVNSILTEPWHGKAGTAIESGLKTEILARALVSAIPTALSQLTNDVGFITASVMNLTHYYLKSETYTQAEVDALITTVQGIHFEVVTILPETGEANVIYLVPREPSGYTQYIWTRVDGVYQYVEIGTTEMDLSEYAKKTWVEAKGYQTSADVANIVEGYGYQTAEQVETIIDGKGFITNAVNDLLNYYLKSETYTKTQVDELIAGVQGIHFEIVMILPETGQTNVIYLVPRTTPGEENYYDEYIWVQVSGEYRYEKIGGTIIDLSNYYTKGETDALLEPKQTAEQVQAIVEGYGYTTMAAVEAKGYQTAEQVQTLVESYGYQTAQQVTDAINTAIAPFKTEAQIRAIIEGYGYTTMSAVEAKGYQTETQSKALVNGVFSFNSETGELDIELYS